MFELATPIALLLLPLPILLWLCLPRTKKTSTSALRVPFLDTLDAAAHQKKQHTPLSLLVLFCIWMLTVFAAAGPRWVGAPRPLTHEGHNIMLILDISGSMDIRDRVQDGRPVTRLDVVKEAALSFVKNRASDQIGLILFGTRAYLQTPLTQDHKTVAMRLKDATVGLAGKTTSIGDAIGLAVKHMQHVPPEGRVIILLTDGASNSGTILPLKAAELARQDKIKVYTIGLGADTGMPLFGNMPSMVDDLDENTLKTIASMTGGRYFHATDKRSLMHTYQLINQLETVQHDTANLRPEHAYYPYPLALALILFMLWYTQLLYRGRSA